MIFGGFCLLAALVLAAMLVHTVWQGAPSEIVVRLGKPKVVVVITAILLVAGALIRAWGRGTTPELIRKLFLLGASLGLSLFVAEVAVRIFLSHLEGEDGLAQLQKWHAGAELISTNFSPLIAICRLSEDPQLLYELKPNLNVAFGNHSLRTNSHGLRDSLEYAPDATGVVRIVGIGDSGMFGWGVDQDQDYLSVMESNLNATAATDRRFDVLNFAVPGYNSGQEFEMMRRRALNFRPNIAIVGWCDNDFGLPFLVTTKRDYSSYSKLYLYKFLFYRGELLSAPVSKPSDLDPSLVDPALIEYTGVPGVTKAFAHLRDLSRENGFHVLVFGPMRAEAVAACRTVGLDYYNTLEHIDASQYPSDYAVLFMHPKPGGHRVLAAHLEAELQRRGWLN